MRSAAAHGLIAGRRGQGRGLAPAASRRASPSRRAVAGAPLRRALAPDQRASHRGGGTVAVYSDLTEVKESEQRAAAANQLILQSLRYASRIQSAVLPARRELDAVAADHFLIWEPRDIVGGDFFWFQPISDGYAVMVGDCTGHGVPGAFMTLIAWGLLDRMLRSAASDNPSEGPERAASRGARACSARTRTQRRDRRRPRSRHLLRRSAEAAASPSPAPASRYGAPTGTASSRSRAIARGVGYRRYPLETAFTDIDAALRGQRQFLPHHRRPDRSDRRPARPLLRQAALPGAAQEEPAEPPCASRSNFFRKALAKYQGQQIRRDDLTVLGFVPHA